MGVLSNLMNERVFEYFEEICSIPHGSGNTKAISDYCVGFAKKHSLEYYQDNLNNVIIYKNASNGYEGHSPVILQGHLDMVCEKDPDVEFDFEKDALNLAVDGDFVFAKGTTLGGDDGIAVAMALAILEDDTLPHPAIEAVFTVDEETGMYGAEGLDATRLKSHTLINIDSEAEGIFTVGCAGGARCTVKKQVKYLDEKMSAVTVKVSGLVGGHSGVEINRGRLNANFVMAKVIYEISKNFPIYIKEINGGSKDNVITRECDAVICCEESVEKIKAVADKVKNEFYCETDSGLRIEIKKADDCVPFNEKVSRDVLGVLKDLKQGILKMSEHIKGLPQTSQNLGVIKTEGDVIKFTYSVRSSVNAERDEVLKDIKELAENNGFDYSYTGVYPAWEYREDSPLRDKMVNVFKELYHKEPVIEVIHAGLECGLLGEKIKGLDAVSFGPDLFDIHTSRERMSIASVKRTYAFLKELIKNL